MYFLAFFKRFFSDFLLLCIKFGLFQQAACGVTVNPKQQIVNIDAADVNNELAVVEYIDDMYEFYKLAEVLFTLNLCIPSLFFFSFSLSFSNEW